MKSGMPIKKYERRALRLVKDWTLPVAMVAGTLLYAVFATLPCLDGAAVWFGGFFGTFLPACMFAILFVTFCKVDFHAMRIARWHVWLLVLQSAAVGIMVWLALLWRLDGDSLVLMESLLACVSCPCAAAAAVVTQKLGGNLELMTTYTFASNLLVTLLIPISFPLVSPSAGVTFLTAFLVILQKVCLILVLPMALAFIVKHTMRRVHRWIVGVKDLSYYLWAMSLMIVTGTTVKNIVHAGTSWSFIAVVAALSLLVCVAQFGLGRLVGSRYGSTVDTGQALGQKNTAFAIWTTSTFLNPLSSIGPGCYILWQNAINAIEIWQAERNGTIHAS